MPWEPLPSIAFAIAVHPFQPTSPADLPLQLGDELYLIEQGGQDEAWFRGYLVAPPSLLAGLTSVKGQALEARVFSGIFPRSCVEVREFLGENVPSDYFDDRETVDGRVVSAATRRTTDSLPSPRSPGSARSKTSNDKRIRSTASLKPMLPMTPTSIVSRGTNRVKPAAPVPMLKIGDETPTSAQEPLVDEIASCLREWHSSTLHELLLNRDYAKLEKLSGLMQHLDFSRKQLLHNVLTNKELVHVREEIVWNLVRGNKSLDREVIVRDPAENGRILISEDSAVKITQLQAMMSLLDAAPEHHVEASRVQHLLVSMSSATRGTSEPVTLMIGLWSNIGSLTQISESFRVDLRDIKQSFDKIRTLFTDLTVAETEEVYLVVSVIGKEHSPSSVNASSEDLVSNRSMPPSTNHEFKGSRRTSIMRSIRGPKNAPWHRNVSSSSQGSIKFGHGGSSSISSVTAAPPPPPKNEVLSVVTQPESSVNKTIAVGCVSLQRVFAQQKGVEVNIPFFSPLGSAAAKTEEAPASEHIAKLLRTEKLARCATVESISVFLRHFAESDPKTLIRETPTVLHNAIISEKISFSGVPKDPRSDVFVKLQNAALTMSSVFAHPRGGKVPLPEHLHPQHFQITVEVRLNTGKEIPACVFSASNSKAYTTWRSSAIGMGENWNETVKLHIPDEDIRNCHLYFTLTNTPAQLLAFAWMPLWQDAFVHDGEHNLLLYKPDDLMPTYAPREGYLSLPPIGTGSTTLKLSTTLCSTVFSQDANVVRLLEWKTVPEDELTDVLKRVSFAPEIEVVKRLSEVLDALFGILVEKRGSDEYEDLVFSVLITVLGIVYDRRFNLEPMVDHYAQTEFNYPFATACLLRSFSRLLSNPTHPESSRKLRATFKVGKHLFKFIINAREQQQEKEAGVGITSSQSLFVKELQNIFKQLEKLMQNPAPILVGSQTLAVQHFHTWLPELSGLLTTDEILILAIDFIDSCASVKGKLILFKLLLIINYSRSQLFSEPEARRALTVNTSRWLAPHWGKTAEVNEQYREQVRLCCAVISLQVNELGESASDYIPEIIESYKALKQAQSDPKDTFSPLFPTSYPFPAKPAPTNSSDEALVELSAVLAAVSNLPTSLHLDLPQDELAAFLFDALEVRASILECDAFPESWLSVHIYQHKSTMKTLETLFGILVDTFLPHPDDAENFNMELWEAFFKTLLLLVGSPALALETFPEQKRRAVWKIAGDVREQGADLLRRSWEAIGWETEEESRKKYGLEKIGGYQVQYVPGLVAPIVELCLSVHEGLRSVAVQILQTMIVSEWDLNGDLAAVQAGVIDSLDRLFKSKHVGENILQKVFVLELNSMFEETSDPMHVAVHDLIATVDEYIDLLVAAHASHMSGEAFQLVDHLRLMDFLRDMQKEDIFIRYVHQLSDIQVKSRNPVEGGLALKLHAELYEWDSRPVPALQDPRFPEQSAFERKEALYFQMIQHFEDGKSWENALASYKELADQYENHIFDFAKLARTQRAMAKIYEDIARGEKVTPRYYRVTYFGLGFPPGLRDKEFIFQGSPSENLSSFTDRMQQQHPAAQVVASADSVDVEGQFLNIQSVYPQDDFTHPVFQRKVPSPIRDYMQSCSPQHFVMNHKAGVAATTATASSDREVVQKTIYKTIDTFPTLLKRSEIISAEVVVLSPLQNALRRILRKTKELAAMEKQYKSGDDITAFTAALAKSVDPMAENGVFRYRDLLPVENLEAQEDEGEEPGSLSQQPLTAEENALKIALMEHVIVLKRCLAAHTKLSERPTMGALYNNFTTIYAPELSSLPPKLLED